MTRTIKTIKTICRASSNGSTQENQAARDREEQALVRERNNTRDRLLSDSLNGLNGVGVVSLDGGIKFFRDDLNYDADTEEWVYLTKDGARYTIPEMVQRFTPDWLKKPQSAGGGSGGGSPRSGQQTQRAEINRVATLRKVASETVRQGDAMNYWRQRKAAIGAGINPADIDSAAG
jgi:hypothetical protein